MPGAVQIFAAAAKDAGKTDGSVAQLNKLMEDGKALAKDLLPYVAVRLKDAARANGALELALKGLNVKLGQSRASLQIFQDTMFNKGVETGLTYLLEGFNDLMKSSTLLATVLGGVFKGAVVGLTLPFRLLYAVIYDITKLFGLHDAKGFNMDIVAITSSVIGLVAALGALLKVGGMVGSLFGVLGGGATMATIGGLTTVIGGLTAALATFTAAYFGTTALLDKAKEVAPEETDVVMTNIGRMIAESLAFFGNETAKKSLLAEASVGGFNDYYKPSPFLTSLAGGEKQMQALNQQAKEVNLNVKVSQDTAMFRTEVENIAGGEVKRLTDIH